MSLSSDVKVKSEGINVDFDSTNFAIDLGSSDHVCSVKSLFVGEITPLENVNLQGVGGVIPASGFGTIQFTVIDDDDLVHQFTIHNVLYVPQAPMNLLSPQKWVAGRSEKERESRGAFSITFDDVTILTWDNRTFTKTVHHRSEGIPIMAVNEGFQSVDAFMSELDPVCIPCCPTYLQTSKKKVTKTVRFKDETDASTPFTIIPNDDNDISNDDEDHQPLTSFEAHSEPELESEGDGDSDAEPVSSQHDDDKINIPITELDKILDSLKCP